MGTVLEIINDSNTVLIDDNYKAYALIRKGVITLPASSGSFGPRADLTYASAGTDAPPMLALVPVAGSVINDNYRRSGQTHTWSIRSNQPGNIEYYIFDLLTDLNDLGGLFQLWNAAGKLIFDSNYNYLKIVQMVLAPQSNFNGGGTVIPVPAGKKYAVAIAAPQYYRVYRNTGIIVGSGIFLYEGDHTYQVAPTLNNAGQIEFNRLVSQVLVGSGPSGQGYSFSRPGQFTMLIDVTNF